MSGFGNSGNGTMIMSIIEKTKGGASDLNQLVDLKGATKWNAINLWAISHDMKIKVFRHLNENSGDCSVEFFNGRKFEFRLLNTDTIR